MDDVRESVLRAAGWHRGRDIGPIVDDWVRALLAEFPPFPEAVNALKEFGQLSTRESGPGQNVARMPFDIDPRLAAGERDRFIPHETRLGASLYPLGECMGGHAFLAILADGRVFAIGDGTIDLVGGTAREAIYNLLVGVRGASSPIPAPRD